MGLWGWKKITNRKARIFISSTFNDMNLERKTIVRQVFPRLRREFSNSFIDIVEIDLRWGVLDEEVVSGNIIEICIGEVRKCSPFFLGLIGSSYGTIPSPQIINNTNEHILQMIPHSTLYGISITEMEMRAGLLYGNNAKEASVFIKNTQRDNRLKSFIDLIENQQCCNTDSYETIEELVEKVYNNLYNHIKHYFVDELVPPKGDITYFDHLNFAKTHFAHYYPDNNVINVIEQIVSDKNICYIQGEDGIGKSAILSYFINYYGNEMDEYVFFHFMQLNHDNKSINLLVSRLLNYLKLNELCSLENESILSEEEILKEALLKLNSRLYLLIDDVDEIIGNHNYLYDFYRLASRNLKILLTGKKKPNRDIPCYKLTLLLEEQIPYIIQKWYSSYDKKVSSELSSIIKTNEDFKNPLVLSFLLDELKVIGDNRTLLTYASERNRQHIFPLLIQELITSSREIVSNETLENLFIFIILSKEGLYESDIMKLLDIPVISWVAIYSILSGCFLECSGIIQIKNERICDTIISILNIDLDEQNDKRLVLINHFKDIKLDYAKREYIWQAFKLGNTKLLSELLFNYDVLEMLEKYDKGLLQCYLVYLSSTKSITNIVAQSLVEIFREKNDIDNMMRILLLGECYDIIVMVYDSYLMEKEKLHLDVIRCYSRSLFKIAKYNDANKTYSYIINNINIEKEKTLNDIRFMYAIALNESGNFGEAYHLLKDVIKYYQKNNIYSTSSTYATIYLANLEYMFGETKSAFIHITEAIEKRKELFGEGTKEMAWTYCFSSPIFFSMGKYDDAISMSQQAVNIDINYYGKLGLKYAWSMLVHANQLLNQGNIIKAADYYEISIKENDKVLDIRDRPHPFSLTSYNNLGVLKWTTHHYDEAREIIRSTIEQKKIKLFKNHCYLANSYVNLGNMTTNIDKKVSLDLLLEADYIYSTQFSPNHPDRIFVKICLLSLYQDNHLLEEYTSLFDELSNSTCEDYFIKKFLELLKEKSVCDTEFVMPHFYQTKNNICEFVILPPIILSLLSKS